MNGNIREWGRLPVYINPAMTNGINPYQSVFHSTLVPGYVVEFIIIDTVFRGFVENFSPRLNYWRLHRRWAPGPGQHIVSVYICTGDGPSVDYPDFINTHRIINELINLGAVTSGPSSVVLECLRDMEEDPIEGYPWQFYETFGAFMQGVSESFLCLLDRIKNRNLGDAPFSLGGLTRSDPYFNYYFRLATETINVLRFRPGLTYLHFLNSAWGYIHPVRLG